MAIQGNYGWSGPSPVDILVTNRTGATRAVGDVGILDNGQADAASTTNKPGASTAGLANVVAVTTAVQPYALYGVFQQAAIDDNASPVRFRLKGQIDAVSVTATVVLNGATKSVILPPANAAVAAQVVAGNSASLLTTATASGGAVSGRPIRIIFIALSTRTGAGLVDGWFDGVNGFGDVLFVPN